MVTVLAKQGNKEISQHSPFVEARLKRKEVFDFADESRLLDELADLKAFDANVRDWRQLDPKDIEVYWNASKASPDSRALLAKAVFVGTMQACLRGRYWAPSYTCEASHEVDCSLLGAPMSLILMPEKLPPLRTRCNKAKISCFPRCHPLDAAAYLSENAPPDRHVAVVRYSSMGDTRNEVFRYGNCREDQIFLRTTYARGFERMETEIHAQIGDALDLSFLIFTPGVVLLRGPIEEGALWYQNPPRLDVIWAALPPRPQLAEQSQYAFEKEKKIVEHIVDSIFAWAAAKEVDTLVLPPLGCGAYGCSHPHLDVADIIHRAVEKYHEYIDQVCIASDTPAHFEGEFFQEFAQAVQNGRPPIHKTNRVPVPPFPRSRKSPEALAEKYKKMNRSSPRTFRNTFL